jgi:hypothetical protein
MAGQCQRVKSAIERSMVVADGQIIEYHHLHPNIGRLGVQETSLLMKLSRLIKWRR